MIIEGHQTKVLTTVQLKNIYEVIMNMGYFKIWLFYYILGKFISDIRRWFKNTFVPHSAHKVIAAIKFQQNQVSRGTPCCWKPNEAERKPWRIQSIKSR